VTEHCATAPIRLWRRVGKPLGRFLAWWFSMFALLGPLSTCPIWGQPGCAGGSAGAAILGGLAAAALWLPRRLAGIFRRWSTVKEGSAECE